jgi:hypothetical protein
MVLAAMALLGGCGGASGGADTASGEDAAGGGSGFDTTPAPEPDQDTDRDTTPEPAETGVGDAAPSPADVPLPHDDADQGAGAGGEDTQPAPGDTAGEDDAGGERDADPDTSEPAGDAALPPDADGGCSPVEIDNALVRCDGSFRMVSFFQDTVDRSACADFVQVAGSPDRWPDVDAAVAALNCEAECRWVMAMSVSLVRCGRRTGYIEFRSETCGSVFEFAEGLYPSVEAWEEANPCPVEERPAGQCLRNGECGGEFGFCAREAPGGICNGCGSDSDCPGSAECVMAVCRQPCRAETDCPAGMTCGSGNLCIIQSCQRGQCPDPRFGCTERGLCQRIACDGPEVCPEGTLCQAEVCVEQR